MIRDNQSEDEGATGDDNLTGQEVVDADAWTDQRGTDEAGGMTQGGQDSALPASDAVLDALADWYGTSKLDLDPPLYECIDPDALNSLLACPTGQVEFDYRDATVTVDHEQNVSVTEVSAE